MRTRRSALSIHFAVRPYCSAPTASATLPVRSTSKWSFPACGVAARILKPCSFSHARASSLVASTIGTENIVPVEARTTFGLCTSVVRSQTMTALAFAASALRRIVPRFPGFSMDSVTMTSALDGRSRFERRLVTWGPTINSPSGRSLYAILRKAAFEQENSSAPRFTQSATSAASFSFLSQRSGQWKIACGR